MSRFGLDAEALLDRNQVAQFRPQRGAVEQFDVLQLRDRPCVVRDASLREQQAAGQAMQADRVRHFGQCRRTQHEGAAVLARQQPAPAFPLQDVFTVVAGGVFVEHARVATAGECAEHHVDEITPAHAGQCRETGGVFIARQADLEQIKGDRCAQQHDHDQRNDPMRSCAHDASLESNGGQDSRIEPAWRERQPAARGLGINKKPANPKS
ncbi:MAG: hypothetical protein H7Y19_02245 [Luteimonas sp.]|nr:hypothetical protein [Luteimonas sp.]